MSKAVILFGTESKSSRWTMTHDSAWNSSLNTICKCKICSCRPRTDFADLFDYNRVNCHYKGGRITSISSWNVHVGCQVEMTFWWICNRHSETVMLLNFLVLSLFSFPRPYWWHPALNQLLQLPASLCPFRAGNRVWRLDICCYLFQMCSK